jgi:lysophospholipase L1-like esterase
MPGSKVISPDNPLIFYTGRINLSDPTAPHFFYAGSYATLRFRGTSARAILTDEGGWNEHANQVGCVINGGDLSIYPMIKGGNHQTLLFASGLDDREHTLTLIKLNGPGDGRGRITLHGVILDEEADLLPPPPLPAFKLEIYGDSVTEGGGAACPEDTNDCGPHGNNGWFSYANVLARLLNGQVHNVGIAGLATLDNTGWYEDGKTGLETTYDKLNPSGEAKSAWDFTHYTPDLVVMAMGVNDQSKGGFNDLPRWKFTYKRIVHDIHERYGGGRRPFVFAVAPLQVYEAYCNVEQLVSELRAEGIYAFYYRYSFEVTGHPNRPQSARMAAELAEFIRKQRLL